MAQPLLTLGSFSMSSSVRQNPLFTARFSSYRPPIPHGFVDLAQHQLRRQGARRHASCLQGTACCKGPLSWWNARCALCVLPGKLGALPRVPPGATVRRPDPTPTKARRVLPVPFHLAQIPIPPASGFDLGPLDVRFYGLFGLERWPTFNVADSSVVVCGILLIISVLFQKEHGSETHEQEG